MTANVDPDPSGDSSRPRAAWRRATVSIGMPAYNSERTIRSAIESMLGQSYRDIELIICDNASTDDTWRIVQEYEVRDPRVVGIRHRVNIGANSNYSFVARAARGSYFKWASSNDLCAPEFIERCVDYLDRHPDAVLVAPRTRLFVTNQEDATDYDCDLAFDDADPVVRFVRISQSLKLNNILNGVIRTDVLRGTPLIGHYPGADVVLLGHLALRGKLALLDNYLFFRRMDQLTATRLMSADAVHRHHYPGRTTRSLFPAWRYDAGWLRASVSGGLSTRDMVRAAGEVARMTYWDGPRLRRDIVDALRFAVGSH